MVKVTPKKLGFPPTLACSVSTGANLSSPGDNFGCLGLANCFGSFTFARVKKAFLKSIKGLRVFFSGHSASDEAIVLGSESFLEAKRRATSLKIDFSFGCEEIEPSRNFVLSFVLSVGSEFFIMGFLCGLSSICVSCGGRADSGVLGASVPISLL